MPVEVEQRKVTAAICKPGIAGLAQKLEGFRVVGGNAERSREVESSIIAALHVIQGAGLLVEGQRLREILRSLPHRCRIRAADGVARLAGGLVQTIRAQRIV